MRKEIKRCQYKTSTKHKGQKKAVRHRKLSLPTLIVNGLSSAIKRHRMADGLRKHDPTIMLSTRDSH